MDLRRIRGVGVGAEDRVGEDARTLLSMMRVDVFPDDLTCRRDLKHAPPLAFADQRVARGEALGAADVRAGERPGRIALILPHCLARAGIELYYPRERILSCVVPIGEQGNVPVGQHLAV